jgi:drug/metabolite transporter (DMT)-like permease
MTQILTGTADQRGRAIGIALVFAATIGWSFSGVFTRLLTIDVWTAIAWRSFFGGLFLLVPYLLLNGRQSGRQLFSIGRAGLALAACNVVCQACTVGGLYFTTVANVTVIYATSPFLAAVLAWLVMGERVRPRTIVAGMVCLAGVVVIISGSVGEGSLLGDMLALVMTLTFAFMVVIPRAYRDLQMLPTTIVSAFATLAIFAPFGSVQTIDIHNWSVLAGFGLTNFSIALFLFLAGARRIASAEAALIGILEIVLAPVWVWLLFSEIPGWPAVAGGGIILVAVGWHTILDLRRGDVPMRQPA